MNHQNYESSILSTQAVVVVLINPDNAWSALEMMKPGFNAQRSEHLKIVTLIIVMM